jgi:hypothetical protein
VGGGGTESAARAATEGGMSDETEGFLEETTSSNIWVSTWLGLGLGLGFGLGLGRVRVGLGWVRVGVRVRTSE